MMGKMKMNSIGHVPRIGILSPATEPGMRHWWNELRVGLNDLGYVVDDALERRWGTAGSAAGPSHRSG